jgi:hypothetical protein
VVKQSFRAGAKINGIATVLYLGADVEQFEGLLVVGKILSDNNSGFFGERLCPGGQSRSACQRQAFGVPWFYVI